MHEATLFLVRVWRDGRSGFRASARRVDEEQPHVFGNADALARFLAGPSPHPLPDLAEPHPLPAGDER